MGVFNVAPLKGVYGGGRCLFNSSQKYLFGCCRCSNLLYNIHTVLLITAAKYRVNGRACMVFAPKTASLIMISRPPLSSFITFFAPCTLQNRSSCTEWAQRGTQNSCFSMSGYETFACTFQMLKSKQQFSTSRDCYCVTASCLNHHKLFYSNFDNLGWLHLSPAHRHKYITNSSNRKLWHYTVLK